MAEALRAAESAGNPDIPPEVDRLAGEVRALLAEMEQDLARQKVEEGIPDSLAELLDELIESRFEGPYGNNRFWRADVQQTPVTVRLEEVVGNSLDAILRIVDPTWLAEQSRLSYRNQYPNDNQPARLHLVGRERLLPESGLQRPHRFAQMLLISKDFLDNRDDMQATASD